MADSLPLQAVPKRIVVKLGTGVLTFGVGQLHLERIEAICAQLAHFHASGVEVIVVSSGAVGLGMGAMGLTERPTDLAGKQACAAIGQSRLMQTWQSGLAHHRITAAQVLLTHDDLRVRSRHLAVSDTLEALLAYDTIPVINENDAVSAAEIVFGDNDALAAMVASVVHAQYLFILSTAPGLIDMAGTGEIVPVVDRITPEIEAMAGGTTSITAVGGMVSKISAAKLATRSGCGTFIASGSEPEILSRLLSGEGTGTFFVPNGLQMQARKRWLAYFQRPKGRINVKADAVEALRHGGRSLLAIGVTGIEGVFVGGDVVDIAGPDGQVIARGQSRFSATEVLAIAGLKTREVKARFPQHKKHEVVHRDKLAVL